SFHLEKLPLNKTVTTLIFCLFSGYFLLKNIQEYAGNQSYEKTIIAASNYVKNVQEKDPKLNALQVQTCYFHPLVAYAFGKNMYHNDSRFIQKYFNHNPAELSALKNGDFIIRDSHFGPMEMGLRLDTLANHPEFALVKEFIPEEAGTSFHGEAWSVKIYQKIPVRLQHKKAPISTVVS